MNNYLETMAALNAEETSLKNNEGTTSMDEFYKRKNVFAEEFIRWVISATPEEVNMWPRSEFTANDGGGVILEYNGTIDSVWCHYIEESPHQYRGIYLDYDTDSGHCDTIYWDHIKVALDGGGWFTILPPALPTITPDELIEFIEKFVTGFGGYACEKDEYLVVPKFDTIRLYMLYKRVYSDDEETRWLARGEIREAAREAAAKYLEYFDVELYREEGRAVMVFPTKGGIKGEVIRL